MLSPPRISTTHSHRVTRAPWWLWWQGQEFYIRTIQPQLNKDRGTTIYQVSMTEFWHRTILILQSPLDIRKSHYRPYSVCHNSSKLFTVPVRSGWSRVGGDYTQTYYPARRCTLSEKYFRDCGIHCIVVCFNSSKYTLEIRLDGTKIYGENNT